MKKVGQVYHTEVETIPEGEPVMMGTFPIANHPALMLFDSGASHTFINRTFVVKHDIPIGETKDHFYIQSPEGRLSSKEMVYQIPIEFGGHCFPTSMIVLKDQDIDVILGMKWMAVGDFKRKQKNPQVHGYRCSFHPGVFQSIDFPQGTRVY